nr:uncharacterized protein LOC115260084 [Aedes albopictus]
MNLSRLLFDGKNSSSKEGVLRKSARPTPPGDQRSDIRRRHNRYLVTRLSRFVQRPKWRHCTSRRRKYPVNAKNRTRAMRPRTLYLQNGLKEADRSAGRRRETLLHPLEVERIIPAYDGKQSSARWIAKIEGYAQSYGWTSRSCLHYAHTRLTGTARKWFEAQDEGSLSWIRFKQLLLQAFPGYTNEAEVHFKLANRVRGKDEDAESFVYDVQRIAKEGNLSEEAIITYVVRNINDDKLQEHLISKDPRRCVDAVSCIQRFVRMRETVLPKPIVPMKKEMKLLPVRQSTAPDSEDSLKIPFVRRCFNCNELGHLSVNCPKTPKKSRCSKCGKVGHESSNCATSTSQLLQKSGPAHIRFLEGEQSTGEAHSTEEAYFLEVDEGSRLPVTMILGDRCRSSDALVDLGASVEH